MCSPYLIVDNILFLDMHQFLLHNLAVAYADRSTVEEIMEMLRLFSEVKVTWTRRSANTAAHKLAKVGVGEELL